MTKSYQLPLPVAIALTTERIQFLQSASIESFNAEEVRRLLTDLIEDRVKLRQAVAVAVGGLKDMQSQVDAAVRKWESLEGILNGTDEPIPR